MALPVGSDLYVSPLLSNALIAYIQSAEDFVTDIFPTIPVDYPTGPIMRYNRADWYRNTAKPRAPGTESVGVGWRADHSLSWNAQVYAEHSDIADQTRSSAQPPVNLDRDVTELLGQQLLLQRQNLFATEYWNTTAWTWNWIGNSTGSTTSTGGDFVYWDDYLTAGSSYTSNPLGNMDTARTLIKKNTGFWPNTMVVGVPVYMALRQHPQVIDRIKYVMRAFPNMTNSQDIFAAAFDVQKFQIAGVVQTTSIEGVPTVDETYDFVLGNDILLAYAAPNPGILTPSAGYTFSWRGFSGMTQVGAIIKKFRMEELESDRIEAKLAYGLNVIEPALGGFVSGITETIPA